MKLLDKLKGFKTYGSVIVSLAVCGLLYLAGADTQAILLVGIGGLLGGTAGLRSALNDAKLGDKANIASQALDAGEKLLEEPQGGKADG